MTVASPASAWFQRFRPEPPGGSRLICFPHAGGSATYYFPVARAMPANIDVVAVQYPGRQDRRREPCVDDIAKLATLVTDELVEMTDRPFAFFGHSMGAIVAFEVARRLQRSGLTPTVLFASGRRAPCRFRDEKPVHRYDDAGLIRHIQALDGTDPEILHDDEMVRLLVPSLRGDYRAVETYRYLPGPPLTCPITALVGDSDSQVTLDEARDWAKHTSCSFELKVFPGGHFYLSKQSGPVLREVTRTLAALSPAYR